MDTGICGWDYHKVGFAADITFSSLFTEDNSYRGPSSAAVRIDTITCVAEAFTQDELDNFWRISRQLMSRTVALDSFIDARMNNTWAWGGGEDKFDGLLTEWKLVITTTFGVIFVVYLFLKEEPYWRLTPPQSATSSTSVKSPLVTAISNVTWHTINVAFR